ncbi:hypothetical protein L873DRAFT_389779 [Choiromyces venosus 120613-1]|uniref:Uncharacterized protein n=1 Tax=Choiromyces venosus 120613-1 TaxID=1336337 RepID=A0A3N4IY41_9PEZI|nr:hypothetical protein L873DRAFT_389779 [Choiromyces venosus 120613-1]
MELGELAFLYWAKVTFIDKYTEKRIPFSPNSNIKLVCANKPPIYAKIDHIFTHRLLGTNRLFLAVYIYEPLEINDSVNGFPLYRLLSDKLLVYGLPAIDPEWPYILRSTSPDEGIHWRCPWMISYL